MSSNNDEKVIRERLETLSLAVLREFAKDKNLKHISALRKGELIEALIKAEQEESVASNAPIHNESEKKPVKRTYKRREDYNKSDSHNADNSKYDNNRYDSYRNDNTNNDNTKYESFKNDSAKYDNSKYEVVAKESARQEDVKSDTAKVDNNRVDSANTRNEEKADYKDEVRQDSPAEIADGILEVLSDGYGFIRCENYLPGENDVYVSPSQIRRFNLKTGDIIRGPKRAKSQSDKFSALLYLETVNGKDPICAIKRPPFETLTPIFPNQRIHLEKNTNTVAMRMVDLISPIGKGQRGMIVSQPKSGKTTLLKQIAKAVTINNPEMHLIILLIDERPEEVTDIKESITGDNVEVIYSTFDELPERHKRVSEMVIERAKRLVEHGEDVIILLDSITRLARAYNLTVQASGRTLSGGLDPAALHMPKKFFGAARNMREGGSLTILATALVDTGSKMDDVVFEEFKGTGNMELVLDRKLSEKRVFPAIDIAKSSTRREDLLLNKDELMAVDIMRKALNGMKTDEAAERILDLFVKTKDNNEFINTVLKNKRV